MQARRALVQILDAMLSDAYLHVNVRFVAHEQPRIVRRDPTVVNRTAVVHDGGINSTATILRIDMLVVP